LRRFAGARPCSEGQEHDTSWVGHPTAPLPVRTDDRAIVEKGKEWIEMATYTGNMQAKPRVTTMVWLAVLAFAVAAVLVIALVTTQGGSETPATTGIVQTQTHPFVAPAGGDPGKHAVPLGNGICHQCAP
jgi:hypothetical protein